MTQTPGGPQTGSRRPNGTDTFLDGLRRIDMRRSDDGWIGGVCAGLATRLGLDPLVIRALFAVLGLALGLGILAYLAAWLLVPDTDEKVHLEEALRHGEAGSVVLLVATVLSIFGTFGWFGGGWFAGGLWAGNFFWGLLGLVLLIGGVAWLWSEWRSRPDPGFYGRQVRAAAPPPPVSNPSETTGAGEPTWPTQSGATAWSPGDTARPAGDSAWSTGVSTSSAHASTSSGESASSTGEHAWSTGEHAWSTGESAWSAGETAWPAGETAWTPGHGAAQPPGSTPPSAPRPRQPKPPKRPARRSAGAAGTLLGTGLALAVSGGLYWAATDYDLPGNPLLLAFAGALGALGLTVLLLGLAGRTSGFPGFLAIVALVSTALFLPMADHLVPSGRMGDYTWSPQTVAELERETPYRLGAGTGTLELDGLSPDDLDGESVSVSVSFGQLVIDVPENLTVQIDAGTAGGVVRDHRGPSTYVGGINVNDNIVIGDGPVDLVIDARVGFGEILLKGSDR
ncbi:PspC domain-containing protein [Ornithinimicrobium murale]|uniref:PspC domain-containing protein n=1 Tax=Ornithinimicrobium murale TaxID=1050153 RepID=UPI000E0CC761|nr:PspC domain-containing protein [Ornithinimicrobium murale]